MEILQRAVKCMPSFWVVDMPLDRRIPFGVDKEKLVKLGRIKSREILVGLGGVEGIIDALKSSACFGIRGDAADVRHRIDVFGSNSFRRPGISRFLYSIFYEMKDFSAVMTLFSAAFLIVVGIILYRRQDGWQDGAYALVFTFVYFVFAAIVELGIQAYFGKVKKSGHVVVVLRNGLKLHMPFSGVLAGDIVCLKSGDKIPADGLFLDGDQSVKLDESRLTGITEIVEVDPSNPFLSAGAKLVEGRARMVVTGVGRTRFVMRKETYYTTRMSQSWKLRSMFLQRNARDDDGNSKFNQGTTPILEVLFYDASGSLSSLNEDTKNLLEAKLRSINPGGFVALKETSEDGIFKKVLKEYLNGGVEFSGIIVENSANGAADIRGLESDQGLKDEMIVEETMIGEDDALVSTGSGGEETTESRNDTDASDRRPDSASMDQLKVAKFCLVEDLTGSEALASTSPFILELLNQGICVKTTENVNSCDDLLESPIERAIISWVIHELNLDPEELEKYFPIGRSQSFNLENHGLGFLMSMENGIFVCIRKDLQMIY
ncbi:UNVERIFIED_CONTAM: Calcium-transporting ATPase 12, plasma membrane-type [Sesamum latifolium]|uniref:Calcium-transporting ATPase 12, plasma membrane-type n=1 Tax=Sesamum latifolium TaxID=2727402 RepID=A0AAW2XSJ4_9LAMI